MADTLVIVESPGKLKTISKFLGKKYKVVASVGHVRDLPKSKIGIDIENNFEPYYINIRGKGDLIRSLKKDAASCKKVLLATDPDREGEAISWHLAYILGIDPKEKCRISFNEITAEAVKEAVKHPRKIDLDLVDAQQARRVIDRIVGYQLSPILWKKVKKGLSAGRVQSVALKIVCDRENEINEFEPTEYWNLSADLLKDGDKKSFEAKFYGKKGKKLEINDADTIERILNDIKDKEFVVSDIKEKEKKKNPAPPFITSTLQQEASRKLNYSTRNTMSVAQRLYEGMNVPGRGSIGLITYMRTDSLRISNEAQASAIEFINNQYGKEYLPSKPRVYKNKNASQDAHEAIRPTYVDITPESVKGVLKNDEYRLYKLIWERFVASQMATAIYDTVTVTLDVNDYTFKAVGSKIKFKGFLSVYKETIDKTQVEDDFQDEDKTKLLPALVKGERLTCLELIHEQKFTQPPARYSEAALIKVLEEKGIGRPSTYASIISTILSRGYVVKEKKVLYPTELGTIVTDLFRVYFKMILDVEFTAHFEENLDSIEEGGRQWKRIVSEFYDEFDPLVKKADDEIGNVELPVEVSDVKCEKCGRMMVYKLGKYGKFLACPGFPECRNIKSIVTEIGVDCPSCGSPLVERKSKRGKNYYPCSSDDCKFFLFNKPNGEKCPECGALMEFAGFRNKKYLRCSNEECTTRKKK